MSTHPSPEQLSAFLDQELPDAVRLSDRGAPGACDACAAHLAELASVDEAVRALPLEEPAGYFDDFASRVRGRIAARPTRRAVPVWTWAAAAAVLLAVVTPLAWRERAAQSPAPAVMRDQVAPPAAVPVAPESAAKPQAPPAGAGAAGAANADGALQSRGRRANEVAAHDRLQRRDQAAEGAPLPEFQESQDKRELGPEPAGAPATAPPARLEEKARVETRAFGYATPPATSQRPHGPAGQQQLAPPPAAAPAPADREAAATAEVVGTDDELRDADLAKEKDDSVRRQKGAPAFESGARTAAGGRRQRPSWARPSAR
jgi:hypothetical protein